MNARTREPSLFLLRFLVLLGAAYMLRFAAEKPGLLPVSWLIGAMAGYGLIALILLLARPQGFLPFFFLIIDLGWVFALCVEAGHQSVTYAWLFVLPIVTSFSTEGAARLATAVFLAVLLLALLEFGGAFYPHPGLAAFPHDDFPLKLLLFLALGLVLMIYSGREERPPALMGQVDERRDDYNLKLKQVVSEKETAIKQLYDKMRQHAVLYEIIGHITRTLDPDKVLELTVKRCKEELRSEVGFLMLVSGNEVVVRNGDGLSQPAAQAFKSKIGERPFGELILTGEPLKESLADAAHPVLDSLIELKNIQRIRDLLVVPLKSVASNLPTRGLLGIANSLEREGFTRDNLEMMTILAGQAVIAMDNAQMVARQKTFFKETIQAFAAAINQKHKYTHVLHSKSVAKWGMEIGREMGLPREEIEKIEIAAILHDIGKIAIPDEVLTKPGVLTPEEMKVMQEHSEKGKEILKGISMLEEIVPWVRHHHERWDGKGYPSGLVGEQIPLGAQVIIVADAFDAMTANRPYHKGLTAREACDVIRDEAGKQFSPRVVEAFLQVMKKRETSGISFEPVA